MLPDFPWLTSDSYQETEVEAHIKYVIDKDYDLHQYRIMVSVNHRPYDDGPYANFTVLHPLIGELHVGYRWNKDDAPVEHIYPMIEQLKNNINDFERWHLWGEKSY